MPALSFLPILLLPFAAIASPSLYAASATCDDVHIFLARGTGEDYPGRQISVVYAICNGTGSAACGYEDVEYPATLLVPEYCTSEGLGVTHGTDQITEYAARCPDAQLVLSGYSQVRYEEYFSSACRLPGTRGSDRRECGDEEGMAGRFKRKKNLKKVSGGMVDFARGRGVA